MATPVTQPAAYTDNALTVDGPFNVGVTVPTPAPAKLGPDKAFSPTPVYQDVAYRAQAPEGTAVYATLNAAAVAKDPSPSSAVVGRDPYKNNGMVGQDYFKNNA